MVRTFPNRFQAEEALRLNGYTPMPQAGRWGTAYEEATIHPIPGTEKVRVAFIIND
jgi:hypothetical protein